ncbi:MAG TPA: biotin/lipoyl-containing protein [Steroidobacteraceae bacterium]|jgi:acetyl-CoA carboxylase biotin carboxyl carrier protein|nr:biotin/lipoyl-containing protein [Steroidobacteraceae bacterium]
MTLTARDVAEITRLLEESSFDELELEIDGLKIHLRRNGDIPRFLAKGDRPQTQVASPEDSGARLIAAPPGIPPANPRAPIDPHLTPVSAPLLGTFYRAPKPGAPPFVEVGASVEPETVIGIIEVMKLMNAVRAGARGVVREIRARDGTLVEYGETLLLIDARESR